MCIRPPFTELSEREFLVEALCRVDALKHPWCGDGQRVIAAARKYLDTLPKPPRKVLKTRYLVVSTNAERGPFLDLEDAKNTAKSYFGGRVVTLEGFDYEPWEEANNIRPAR